MNIQDYKGFMLKQINNDIKGYLEEKRERESNPGYNANPMIKIIVKLKL